MAAEKLIFSQIPLSKSDLNPSPINQFQTWFHEATLCGQPEPNAMTLATVDQNYDVTARTVLLKSVDEQGFVFYTNYLSPKGQALKAIPKAALVFWWQSCQRQVRVTGTVTVVEAKLSDDYFASRPQDSQIASIISKQSEVIPSRDYLLEKFNEMQSRVQGKPIPRPDFWGGFRLIPSTVEFWQGREHRMSDRFKYLNVDDIWQIVQLSP
ncbi:pyridoxamine 5'-phosphate oxidase [Candidatus Berkiella aquae]|uniref:Pyridoxine/pyridoxamine 5'-phosphate oxidase n=1 Tax=Candidatus Berkiella aquae TaxID=295108 RepID=A0A0Q9YLP0_9GAMM|nr:pyridoxamine 5'-phosphate oxidase [Candidatus Berkiella aquae]MCS5711581.1 pyridoxamine 5'-phosphate oxidase [Candidatus Berkiella aquae]